MGSTYNCEEIVAKSAISEMNNVITLEGANKYSLGLNLDVLTANRASCNITVNDEDA